VKAHRVYSLLTRYPRFNHVAEEERAALVTLVQSLIAEAVAEHRSALQTAIDAARANGVDDFTLRHALILLGPKSHA
jgi:hypothetical protein